MKTYDFSLGMVIRNRIHEDDVFNNYAELCDTLGLEVKTGNSKIAQLKEIERFVRYTKLGNSFYIKEVRKNPLPVKDARTKHVSDENPYYMRDLFINYLYSLKSDGEYTTITHTPAGWASIFESLNNYASKDMRNLTVNGYMRSKIEGRMNSNKFIKDNINTHAHNIMNILNKSYYLYGMEENVIFNKIGATGLIEQRIANKDEYDDYARAIRQSIVEMGADDCDEIYYAGKEDEFLNRIEKNIKDNLGWNRWYYVKTISFKNKSMKKFMEMFTPTDDMVMSKGKDLDKRVSEIEVGCIYGFRG